MNSKGYSAFETASNLLLINLLWLLMCLPIVTIFPATAAMFAVIRQLVLYKDSSVIRPFFRFFKENFKQSFLLGMIWLLIGFFLYFDYRFMNHFGSIRTILLPILFFFGILYSFSTVFLFSVMVHYKANWRTVIKNSIFLSIIHFPSTLLGLVILVGTAILAMALPITGVIIFSISTYGVFSLCNRSFRKVERLKGVESVKEQYDGEFLEI
ncbi:putative membrane protein YesL [Mesobacillus foraminis]|uniref:Putative membrane protein YesL n=2 Tax=Mesobacillus foraminis TaxID=279826 RepID=A0A4R2BAH4_9BACI|nr:putative membrane protein YesL [Mesobacillus foraminis]